MFFSQDIYILMGFFEAFVFTASFSSRWVHASPRAQTPSHPPIPPKHVAMRILVGTPSAEKPTLFSCIPCARTRTAAQQSSCSRRRIGQRLPRMQYRSTSLIDQYRSNEKRNSALFLVSISTQLNTTNIVGYSRSRVQVQNTLHHLASFPIHQPNSTNQQHSVRPSPSHPSHPYSKKKRNTKTVLGNRHRQTVLYRDITKEILSKSSFLRMVSWFQGISSIIKSKVRKNKKPHQGTERKSIF